jgi:hypothetical protein
LFRRWSVGNACAQVYRREPVDDCRQLSAALSCALCIALRLPGSFNEYGPAGSTRRVIIPGLRGM